MRVLLFLSTILSINSQLLNKNDPTTHRQANTWTPQLVPSCRFATNNYQIFAVEMRTPEYGNVWERQLRISTLPTEIESRVRCLDWDDSSNPYGGAGPRPPTASCNVDDTYFVGSKRTMLAAILALKDYTFLSQFKFKVLILGLGGGNQPRQIRSLFPESEVHTVEIDEHVVQLAQKCFGLSTTDPKQHVYVDEAAAFVRKAAAANTKYDLIIDDIPRTAVAATADGLHSATFYTNIVHVLTPNGLFLTNVELLQGTSSTDTSAVTEGELKNSGFLATRSLMNLKVSRAIVIGSINTAEEITFNNLKENCHILNLTIENGEQWRNCNILREELDSFGGV